VIAYITAAADGTIMGAGTAPDAATACAQCGGGETCYVTDSLPFIDDARLELVGGSLAAKPGHELAGVPGDGLTLDVAVP
jgi:hypothetical protein